MATFRYTVQKDGGEQIMVKAFNQDLEVDATAAAQPDLEQGRPERDDHHRSE
jgi:hypothetical protein